MRSLVRVALFVLLSFEGSAFAVTIERFIYRSVDGSFETPCEHKATNSTFTDWKLLCTDGKIFKRFYVHTLVKRLTAEWPAAGVTYQVGIDVFPQYKNRPAEQIRGGFFTFSIRGQSLSGEHLSFSQVLEKGVTELVTHIKY